MIANDLTVEQQTSQEERKMNKNKMNTFEKTYKS